MDKVQLCICNRCKKIILPINSICSNCLEKVDVVNVHNKRLDIRLIEYTRSMINNELLAFVEVRFDGMSIRVFGKIDKPSNKFEVKEWNDRFEFSAI